MNKYIPHTPDDIRQMLDKIGVNSIDDLFADIPESVRLQKEYDLPEAISEEEIRAYFKALGEQNQQQVIFAGGGAYDHYTPSAIDALLSRSEFLTAYTPYQPEISQGTLQYIFEYQSHICELTGMDCTNASMYDGATATVEAIFMAVAQAKKKNRVLVSATINPTLVSIINTYAKYKGINVDIIPEVNGHTDRIAMQTMLAEGDVAGVLVGSPNHYGIIEDYTGFADDIHAAKALMIMHCDPSSLAVLKTPAAWGADIACGDGQSLGIPLSFGGPYVGFLACKKELVRKLPGRIVGATKDVDGKRAFVLTLQAREQHIRREKANSNICSNQSLMALHITIYLALMGKQGLREVNEQSYGAAHYLHDELVKTELFTPAYPNTPFLKEFALRTTLPVKALQSHLAKHGFMAGIALGDYREGMDDCILFCATEKRTKQQIDELVKLIKEAKL
ncbi:MAG: aminomethyl-transferring glycine dehydrogenase subunit GcvPA [Bacteroidaceae bacterium]|nr:aminomethyl-transferring glycine dehydrogenase subunit GcvPA [Bacteroidaceae bacterium]